MKQNSTFSATAPNFVAQDYLRGWELAQKEYLRQEKQALPKPVTRYPAQLSRWPRVIRSFYQMSGNCPERSVLEH